jgi:ABC-type Na+ efflux pump permease subunit
MSKTLTTLQFWLLSITVALALVMVLLSISLFLSNRSVQAEVNSRQQYINDSIKINRLSNQLIQSLANLSAQTKDDKLKGLLSAHGIQFSEKSLPLPSEESK